ncbi:glycosyltransferase family 4 protein [Paenibacillus sp. IB182496]|uniref:Glycosyltransferase family 4 protein n=1 Tax=Paenibacillus sabuli TaxID=2772509 RepID=A0A927BZ73_9BACL|nr:glycosyltransferase family 4 protein [Paenibacillus sabuli]MBD2848586.1 glycosyltransferase family 4 protein [Paenibacillus sabuli]
MARIVHVTEFSKGGIETHLNELLIRQSGRHDIYLIAAQQDEAARTLRVAPDRLLLYPYRRHPLAMLQALLHIRRLLRRLAPDIVHVHGTFAGLFVRLALPPGGRRPRVVYCAHGWSFLMDTAPWKRRLYGLAERLLALRTDRVINISANEHRAALRIGIPAAKSSVIYNGISGQEKAENPAARGDAGPEPGSEPGTLSGATEEAGTGDTASAPAVAAADFLGERLPSKPPPIRLLYIGRFDRQKGFDVLMDTFRGADFPGVSLQLVGDAVLGGLACDIPDGVTRLGWVPNAEIGRCIDACDALVVPSRWEGFGIVAIEALRGGKPVIASNRGALPEIVAHGETGYLFDFDRPEQLAAIIRGLDKRALAEMAPACRAAFAARFHAERMLAGIERLYADTLARRPRRRAGRAGWEAGHERGGV